MILNEFTKKDFWRAVVRLALAFFFIVMILGVIFYLLVLPFDDFKNYIVTENAIRKMIFVAAFAPIYGILLTLFQRTIKMMK